MKVFKTFCFIMVNAVVFGGIGFLVGMGARDFFYPGAGQGRMESQAEIIVLPTAQPGEIKDSGVSALTEEAKAYGVSLAVSAGEETLCVDTKYILREIDLNTGVTEETSYKIPLQYVGMNRTQFIEAMNIYQLSPPLQELERGFEHLEVNTFSREKVIVEMCYRFIQPSSCYYIAAYDNEIVVYLEDKKTIYIETGIPLDSLPEELKGKVIEMYRVEDESILYDFLENYTS